MWQLGCLYAVLLLVALPLSAQSAPSIAPASGDKVPAERFPVEWYPATASGLKMAAGIEGLPYVATVVFIGYDPGDPKHEMRFQQMRDSRARYRNEIWALDFDAAGKLTNSKTIMVSDPVSRCTFDWVEGSGTQPKVAHVQCLARDDRFSEEALSGAFAALQRGGCPGRFEVPATCEPLGESTIGGIRSMGRRETEKEEPPYVEEYWWSPELKIPMGLKITRGTVLMSWALQNVRRVEPDPGMFYPPAEYKIEKK